MDEEGRMELRFEKPIHSHFKRQHGYNHYN